MNNQDLFSIHCLAKSLVEKIITEKFQNLTEEDLEDCNNNGSLIILFLST